MDLSTEQDRPTSPKSSGQRFVEPCRFTDAQRTSLLITLKELGIGDDESRSLFLAALEYDLARCQSLLAVNPGSINAVTSPQPPRPTVSATDPLLSALASAATAAAKSLAELNEQQRCLLTQKMTESDCLSRGYSQNFLEALRLELEHLGAALREEVANPESLAPQAPMMNPEMLSFLHRFADAFIDCFEMEPDAKSQSPFPLILRAFTEATGLPIAIEGSQLEAILRHAR